MILGKPPCQQPADRQRIDRLPRRRRDAEQLKLDRPLAADQFRRRRVDAVGVSLERLPHRRRGALPFRLRRIAKAQRQEPLIEWESSCRRAPRIAGRS